MAYTWHTHGHGRLPPTALPDHEGYDMDSVLTTMRTKYNMEPTAISYNVLLSVCVRTNDLERGEDVDLTIVGPATVDIVPDGSTPV
ncbi:uncharacterized protein HaLaN_12014, partial [Haematococcus lacustris]